MSLPEFLRSWDFDPENNAVDHLIYYHVMKKRIPDAPLVFGFPYDKDDPVNPEIDGS